MQKIGIHTATRKLRPWRHPMLMMFFLLLLALSANNVRGQVSLTNGSPSQTITFDATLSGVCNGQFAGSGFEATPSAGRLDSDGWAHTGMSDGDLAFGGTGTSGDHAQGASIGGVTTAGFYGFDTDASATTDRCLGIQPTAADWTPGTVTLRIQNNGTTNITSIDIAYEIKVLNNEARSNSFNFSHSPDNSTYASVGSLDYTSTAAASGSWTTVTRSTTISSLNITPGSYFYFRWSGNDVGGSGSRDEFGLDDIAITATFAGGGTPSITLADNGTQVTAANVTQGTTAHVLHKSQLAVTVANATLTGMTCTTAGTIDADDISNLKVRYSTDATLDAGDATLSTIAAPGTAGAETFGTFTSQVINSGSTGYIFITADMAAGATIGHTISVNALTNGDFTFSSGTESGSTTAGGAQTIIAAKDNNSAVSVSGILTEPASIASTYTSSTGLAVFDFTFTDAGSGDLLPTIIDQLVITQGSANDVADWTKAIAGAVLNGPDQTNMSGTVSTTGITFASNDMISIADAANETYTLSIWLLTDLSAVADGNNLEFAMDYTDITEDASGSSFGSGAPESGDANVAIAITATQLLFVQQPTNTAVNAAMSPSPTVKACDANGNVDIDYSTAISVSSSGTMTGEPVAGSWSNGVATFTNLTHTATGSGLTLTAASGALANEDSDPFDISAAPTACATDLIISEYYEGASNDKYIEIYNGTSASIDLTAYKISIYSNGNTTATLPECLLTGTIAAGATHIIANSSANVTILGLADETSGSLGFNGDDAVALRTTGNAIIDVIGVIGTDPGTEWGSGVVSTADNTLVRKSSVTEGDTDGSDAFDASVWDGFANTTTYAGSHTMTCGPKLTVSAPTLTGFTYTFGSGPSAVQSFALTGSNLDNSDVTLTASANYEISSSNSPFTATSPITLTTYNGSSTTIYVRLKSGLIVNTYNSEVINISGGGDSDGATVTCSGSVTAVPDITLADNGTQITAANVEQGTTAHILHKSQLTVATANASLTGMTCTSAGTYDADDLTNLKVRYSTDATLDAGDATLSTITSPAAAGAKSFATFTSQTINSGSTGYIFITADFEPDASTSNTISINALTNGDFTFASGNESGSTTAGGSQTIIAATTPLNIAYQGFEADPATPEDTWTYSGGTTTESTTRHYSGSRSLRISGSSTVTFANIPISAYDNVVLSVAFSASGSESDEDLYMDISYDNGSTWNGAGTVKLVDGYSNANVAFGATSSSNPATVTANPWTVNVDNAETQIAVRFRTFEGLESGEYYYIDEVKLTGETGAPGITLTGSDPSSDALYQGNSDNIVYRIKVDVTGGINQDITQIQLDMDALADNLSSLVSAYTLHYSSDATLDAGDTELDNETTIAAASSQTITFNGFTQTINTGTSRYFFITTDVLNSAAIDEQLQASTIDVTFTTNGGATPTENYAAANAHDINSGIGINGADPSSTDFAKGSSGNVLYRIALDIDGQARTLTDIAVTIEGTANLNTLVNKYEAWYSTDNTFDAGDVLLDNETTIEADGSQAVFFSCSQALAAGATYYIFITCDVPTTATGGRLLSALNTGMNIDFTGSPTPDAETYAAANLHEILDTPSDVIAVAASESDYVSSIINTTGPLTSVQGVQVWQFTVRDGGEYGDGDALATIVTALTLTQNTGNAMNNWNDAILSCDLFDGVTHLDQATITTNQIQFSGFSCTVADNTQKTLTVRLSIQTSPNDGGSNNDGDDFVFNLSSANITANPAGSQFGTFPVASSENGKNVFQVVATTLAFVQQPSDVGINAVMVPYVTVEGTDANGNIDNGPLTVSITSGGTMDVATKYAGIVDGLASFGDIIHTALGSGLTLTASASGAAPATSDPFDVLDITTFKPGELLVVGFDSKVDGGSSDAIYLVTLVDIKPNTTFKWVNSRFEAGAAANERTMHWGGGGDEPYEDPSYLEIKWTGGANIAAGSIISFQTSGSNLTSPRVNSGADANLVLSDHVGGANVSSTEGDQMWLVQGEFVPYGTVNVDRYNLLNGTVLFGLTSIKPWVAITSAVRDDDNTSGTNTGRESRTHPDIECFNVDLSIVAANYIYYKNGTGGNPGIPIHTGTKRELLLSIQTTANWASGNGGDNLDIDEEFIAASATPSDATSIGKQFSITASGTPDGTWIGGASGQTTDWFYCGNWQGLAVPDKETDVTIPAAATDDPNIDCNTSNTDAKKFAYVAECKDLTIEASATLTVDDNIDTLKIYGNLTNAGTIDADGSTNDGQIWIDGNWTNNGIFTYGTSNVVFHGTSQTIATSAASETFYNVSFLNGTKTLDDPITANNITIADAGILDANDKAITLTGNWDSYNSSAFDESNTTVTFNGGGAQSISTPGGESFNTLVFANAGTKSLAGDLDVNTLTLSGTAALTMGAYNLNVANNWTQAVTGNFVPGTSTVIFDGAAQTINNTANTIISFNNLTIAGSNNKNFSDDINIAGDLTINNGATLVVASPCDITIQGNWTNNSTSDGLTLSPNDRTVTFNGTAQQSITGSVVSSGETFANLIISNASAQGVTLNSNLTIDVNCYLGTTGVLRFGSAARTLNLLRTSGDPLEGSGSAVFDATGAAHNIYIKFTPTIDGAIVSLDPTSTVYYDGTNQSFITNLTSYGNLTLGGSNTKTIPASAGPLDIAGNFTITGTATVTSGINALSIGGNYTVYGDGAFNLTGHTVTLDGSGAQGITGTETFNNLTVNKSGGSVTANNSFTVNGTLTMTASTMNSGSNTITLGSSAALSESETSYITGNVATTRNIGSSVAQTFGGLGLSITETITTNNSTAVTRVTGTAAELTGNSCCPANENIWRYYDIVPTTNTGLNASLSFGYWEHELNGADEVDLLLFKAALPYVNSGSQWTKMNGTANAGTNTVSLSGITSFSRWTLADEDTPLPIELLSFELNRSDDGVNVDWTTASELNNDYFTLEYSINNSDIDEIYTVKGAGTSNSLNSYSFTHKEPIMGFNYYRIKQTDFDGTSNFSDWKSIYLDKSLSKLDVLRIVKQNDLLITVSSPEAKPYRIDVYTVTGMHIYGKDVKPETEIHQVKIEDRGYPFQMLIIHLHNDKESVSKKLIVSLLE